MTTSNTPARLDLNRTPLTYPGAPIETSLLLLPNCTHRVAFRTGRRLGNALVERCDACIERDGLRIVPLSYELLRWNVANIDARYAVVAVGSNASADVLYKKMGRAGVEPIIPLVKARLDNITVSHSAHVGRPGFVPAAPVSDAGQSCDIVVGFLDRDQLQCMDETEPNYVRRWLDGSWYPLLLDGREALDGFHIYDSRWGLLAEGGRPLPLDAQLKVSAWLADRGLAPWAQHDARKSAEILAGDIGLRDKLRGLFVECQLVIQPGIEGPIFTTDTYGATGSTPADLPTTSATSLRTSTTPDLDRHGQQCVLA